MISTQVNHFFVMNLISLISLFRFVVYLYYIETMLRPAAILQLFQRLTTFKLRARRRLKSGLGLQ